jgi:hypothetical protein
MELAAKGNGNGNGYDDGEGQGATREGEKNEGFFAALRGCDFFVRFSLFAVIRGA